MPYVEANGICIYYETDGPEEAPVLLLLHGALQSGESLAPLRRALKPYFRLLVPDLRGHGKTDNPDGNLTDERMAADVKAFAEALERPPYMVCGYSMGGSVALRLAHAYPGLLKACVILGSRHRVDPAQRSARVLLPENVRQRMPQWAAQLPQKHVHTPWEELARALSRLFQVSPDFSAEALARISCPVLVVHGERDEMVPVEQARELAAAVPGARLLTLPNAAHTDLFFRAPAHKEIIRFLDEV